MWRRREVGNEKLLWVIIDKLHQEHNSQVEVRWLIRVIGSVSRGWSASDTTLDTRTQVAKVSCKKTSVHASSEKEALLPLAGGAVNRQYSDSERTKRISRGSNGLKVPRGR